MKKILSVLFILFPIFGWAQSMQVESMGMAPLDLSASTNQRKDFNGNACALIKVSMTVSNATFGGSIIGDVLRDGSDYWVYVPAGTKMLQVKHPNFKTLMVTFPKYGVDKIEGKCTYILNINLPYVDMSQSTIVESYPSEESAEESDQTEAYVPKEFKPKKIKDYINAFFPVFGIMPGKTTPEDARKLGYKSESENLMKLQDTYIGTWGKNDQNTYRHFQVTRMKDQMHPKMPKKWADDYGFDMELSYNEWFNLFNSLGFRIDVKKEPTVEEFQERDVLKGEFRATEPGGRYYFDLIFGGGNKNNEGSSVNSPGSLMSFNLIYIENKDIENKVNKTKGVKGAKLSSVFDLFFPVYGVTLGKTSWHDMTKSGFELSFYGESCFAEVLSLNFADFDNKGYFDKVSVSASDIPAAWNQFGFQKDNSYETWLKVLDDLGFTIIINEEPAIGQYKGRDVLKANFSAISDDARLKIDFNFNYGNNGADVTSPGTLYELNMTVQ